MSERLFLVESDQAGLRAALVADRRLHAIEIDRAAHPTRVGSVATAKVVRTVQGLGTIVKLDDGMELLLDRGGPPIQAGEEIAVQVTRAPRGDKLGIASRTVTLAGLGVVHLPHESGTKFSRRLEVDDARRAALEALVAGKPGGWIFRRSAAQIDMADFASEIAALAVEGQGAGITAPDAFRRLATNYAAEPPGRILAAGLAARRTAERWCRAFAPSLEARIEPAEAGLFDLHDLDEAISALTEPRVPLSGGASLVIEPTEALTVIDVNAGPEANALSVNLTAAGEIGRQLRLRHIGGIVVIDFISMTRPRDRERIVDALKVTVADDPAQTYIVPMSALGLVEMTRERRGPGLEFER
jgi:ribonuclease E/ribonuclease G